MPGSVTIFIKRQLLLNCPPVVLSFIFFQKVEEGERWNGVSFQRLENEKFFFYVFTVQANLWHDTTIDKPAGDWDRDACSFQPSGPRWMCQRKRPPRWIKIKEVNRRSKALKRKTRFAWKPPRLLLTPNKPNIHGVSETSIVDINLLSYKFSFVSCKKDLLKCFLYGSDYSTNVLLEVKNISITFVLLKE